MNITTAAINLLVLHVSCPSKPPNLHWTAPPKNGNVPGLQAIVLLSVFYIKIHPWVNISIPVIWLAWRLGGNCSYVFLMHLSHKHVPKATQTGRGIMMLKYTQQMKWLLFVALSWMNIFYVSCWQPNLFLIHALFYHQTQQLTSWNMKKLGSSLSKGVTEAGEQLGTVKTWDSLASSGAMKSHSSGQRLWKK